MVKNKYIEQKYLCGYDLDKNFFDSINIKVDDIIPLRKVFVISTKNGKKILKKIEKSSDEINMINECLLYIKKTDPDIIEFNKFPDGNVFKEYKGNMYVVMDIFKGHEVSFSNPVEVDLCAKSLAKMHKSSKGIMEYINKKYNKNFIDKSFLFKIDQCVKNLKYIKDMVSRFKYKNEFDDLFFRYIDKYLDEVIAASRFLLNSSYNDLRQEKETICVCHNDTVYRNFIVNNDRVSLIDFDFMTIDLRVMDVADFILKTIKNAGFDFEKMKSVLQSYESVSKLDLREKKVLYGLLYFPKDFYNISLDYYFRRKMWDYNIYLDRLKMKIENDKLRYQFLDFLRKEI
ncbi:CotS family spore coat protein [Clostridium sp. BJN0001]|uniref:CotS family spore coat protein n=1 Tax=Clostridium sp. BJN0001 TaxID=2930219 RepID=UPI001FD03957|nr:CotS family spore coat protein [Clostridium sp. BJN0001]